jgi:site-specific DNA-methyltransferase (cytosine-N4-specific)
MSVQILQGDARALPLPDASVDLIVTSPPFWGLRSYTDGGKHFDGQLGAEPTPAAYIDNLITCTAEWLRVLKPTGSLWVNLGDKYARPGGGVDRASRTLTGAGKGATARRATPAAGWTGPREKSLLGLPWRYAIRCTDELALILRAEVIWSKPNGLPESVTDRVRRAHEQWFHFTLGQRYYASVDAIREPHEASRRDSWDRRPERVAGGIRPTGSVDARCGNNPLGKLPGSVRKVATQPLRVPAELGVDHFAAFPMEWPRWIISGWSPANGVVLDPFGGTGTTALVASVLGRRGISVDMSADYCRLAAWRTSDPKQRARAARGPRRAAA